MDFHIVAIASLTTATLRFLADGGYTLYARGVAEPDTLIFARQTPPALADAPAADAADAAPDAAPTA